MKIRRFVQQERQSSQNPFLYALFIAVCFILLLLFGFFLPEDLPKEEGSNNSAQIVQESTLSITLSTANLPSIASATQPFFPCSSHSAWWEFSQPPSSQQQHYPSGQWDQKGDLSSSPRSHTHGRRPPWSTRSRTRDFANSHRVVGGNAYSHQRKVSLVGEGKYENLGIEEVKDKQGAIENVGAEYVSIA